MSRRLPPRATEQASLPADLSPVLLAVLLALGPWSCALRSGGADGRETALRQWESRQAQTLAIYQSGEFGQAAWLFAALTGNGTDPVRSRRALLGLACSRMAEAQTSREAVEALDLWREWARQEPRDDPGEEARLLLPLLARLSGAEAGPRDNRAAGAGPASDPALSLPPAAPAAQRARLAAEAREELAALRRRLDAAARELVSAQESLRARAAENEKLRRQIDALERLHLEMTARKRMLDQ